ILTTDEEKIPDYHNATGNKRVHAFPFAAQPALHWPRALAGRKERACFAGSWYGGRHATRANAMLWLLRAAMKHGLDIYDRNHGQEGFCFPQDLEDCVRGSLPYEEVCREYAAYRVFLNVNSVSSSPTMFSRRVFELLASGTPVVSTYATGIERLLGTDSVWFVDSPAEASEAVQTLLVDDAEWRRRSLNGIRKVFATHTYAHRLAELCRLAGVESCGALEPRILIAMDVQSDGDLDRLFSFRQTQTWQAFDLAAVDASGTRHDPLRERQVLPFQDRAGLLRHLSGDGNPGARYDLFGRIHSRAQYGSDYLLDLVNATRYVPSADGWAKSRREDLFRLDGDFDEYACLVRAEKLSASQLGPLKSLSLQVYCVDTSEFARQESQP
ncbi:MAG: glycosyltransferase, partial [Polyangiaceae bacterium]|nr:glycosyltransferase [Polyangiaceae bacterium]